MNRQKRKQKEAHAYEATAKSFVWRQIFCLTLFFLCRPTADVFHAFEAPSKKEVLSIAAVSLFSMAVGFWIRGYFYPKKKRIRDLEEGTDEQVVMQQILNELDVIVRKLFGRNEEYPTYISLYIDFKKIAWVSIKETEEEAKNNLLDVKALFPE